MRLKLPHQSIVIVLLLLTPISTTEHESSAQFSEQLSYEKLYVKDSNVILEFFVLDRWLPVPLRNLIKQSDLYISYGSRKMSSFGITNRVIPKQGISILFGNITEISSIAQFKLDNLLFLETISAVFSLSLSHTSNNGYVWLPEVQSMYYSSANDKFCIQHVEQVIRNLLPCKNHAGIAQIIDIDSLFKKGDIGMQVHWSKAGIQITIIFEFIRDSSWVLNALKQIKITDKCNPYFHQFLMLDANDHEIYQNEIVIHKLRTFATETRQLQKHDQRVQIYRRIIGNWYSHQKIIEYRIHSSNRSEISKIVIREKLPLGSNPHQVHINSQYQQKYVANCSQQPSTQKQHITSHYYLCTIQISIENNSQMPSMTLSLHLINHLIPFEFYESIYGGGEEMLTIPIVIQYSNGSYLLHNVQNNTMRMPLPDESLPFTVMSLTLLVLAYVYLSIWRNTNANHDEQYDIHDKQLQPHILNDKVIKKQ